MKENKNVFIPEEKPKYFLKLITNEKIYVSLDEFNQYVHRYKGDVIIVKKPLATLYIPREQIIFGAILEE